jgi:pyridinium-3,5-biscarboxylic acid mononucleotide synthase
MAFMTVSQGDGRDGPKPDTETGAARTADLGFARLDLDRARRTGDPEVVFGAGKTPDQIVTSLRALHDAHPGRAVLGTRLQEAALRACAEQLPGAEVDEVGRLVMLGSPEPPSGRVAVVAAGTSDLPVVHECAATVRVFGAEPDVITDVGVAGLHRLTAQAGRIAAADAVVAVAGMEAALPSVLGGLVGAPLIAVPTSVGYGWHLDGLTAWLGALNSCAPGVVSVNVDNGFGAGVAAARIARAVGDARAAAGTGATRDAATTGGAAAAEDAADGRGAGVTGDRP